MWRPELNRQIEEIKMSCVHCQRVKNAPTVAPLHPWNWPSVSQQSIHIDFAGPFQGQTFFIVVDPHSKWPEVVGMKNTTVEATICKLHQLFSCYDPSEQVFSCATLDILCLVHLCYSTKLNVPAYHSAPL